MAVKDYTLEEITPTTMVVTWDNLQNGDTGVPLPASQWAVVSFVITGTGGAGGELQMQNALSPASSVWTTPTPLSSFPTVQVIDKQVYGAFRPSITNGDGSTDLKLTINLMPFGKNI